jgi:Tfp pilus assembly protein PilF
VASRILPLLVTVVASVALACRPAQTPPAPAETRALAPSADALRTLAPEVRALYREAQGFVTAGNLDQARATLERAVAGEPDFTEAWYNLGATYSNLSVQDAGRGADGTALSLFRQAVTAKERARTLMNEDKWFLYREREREIVRHDVEEALRDSESVMADEAALLVALRMRARAVRSSAE